MGSRDFCIVGLGNPGEDYARTRHNVGFFVVEEFCRRWNAARESSKWQSLYSNCSRFEHKIHFVKPLTFMNKSGEAVQRFYNFYKLDPDQLLVVHDDLDMKPSRVKLVRGGGHGGHNGIRSLVSCLGEKEFFRLKIGIGRPGQGDVHKEFPVEKYVLSQISPQEEDLLQSRYDALEEGIIQLLSGDSSRAMGILNSLK